MKIREKDLKQETILEIGRFTVLWNWFECNCFERDCKASKIMNEANKFIIDSGIQKQFAYQLNKRRIRFGQDIETYVREYLYDFNKKLEVEWVVEMVGFLEDTKGDTTCGCLLAVCRIRNNLMHGIKDIRELDEQIELFRAANEVLENIQTR